MKKTNIGPLLILLAGCFWGSMGLFVRTLQGYGFGPMHITSLRLVLAGLFFALLLLLKDPQGFRLRARDTPLFLGLGLGSILFFTLCYFSAITLLPLSTAAILLYTSPIWVTLLSALVFKERLTGRKLLALGLAFGGCVLVSGLSGGGISPLGLLLGLGSGLGYGLYSILGTVALRRYAPLTVTTYTFLIAGIGSCFVCPPGETLALFQSAPGSHGLLALLLAATALITAVIPFLSYTKGLQSVPAGKAAILATVEPLVAALFGALVFHEALTPLSCLGILLILAAVVLLNRPGKTEKA